MAAAACIDKYPLYITVPRVHTAPGYQTINIHTLLGSSRKGNPVEELAVTLTATDTEIAPRLYR